MSYRLEFYQAGKRFTDFGGNDASARIAEVIRRSIRAYNSEMKLFEALMSLLCDSRKSNYEPLGRLVAELGAPLGSTTAAFFEYLVKLAGKVGLECRVLKIEVVSLQQMAAAVLSQNRFFYSKDKYQLPATVYAKYPELHRDPGSYIKERMSGFLSAYLTSSLDTKAYYTIHQWISAEPIVSPEALQHFLNEMKFQEVLTAATYKKLVFPLETLLKKMKSGPKTEDLKPSCLNHLEHYLNQNTTGELKFLNQLRRIHETSEKPAEALHALLRDGNFKLSETYSASIRKPLILIIKDYNQFVLQWKAESSAAAANEGNKISK